MIGSHARMNLAYLRGIWEGRKETTCKLGLTLDQRPPLLFDLADILTRTVLKCPYNWKVCEWAIAEEAIVPLCVTRNVDVVPPRGLRPDDQTTSRDGWLLHKATTQAGLGMPHSP